MMNLKLKVSLIILGIFMILGPMTVLIPTLFFPGLSGRLLGYYTLGLIPATIAGVFHFSTLLFITSRTNFLHSPFDLLRSLYVGGPLGLLSGIIGAFLFVLFLGFSAGANPTGLKIIGWVYVCYGGLSGILCGLVSTPISMRSLGT